MDTKLPKAKVLSFDRGEFWVEALVAGQSGISGDDPITFPVSAIGEIGGFGAKHSFIKLNTGREIFFGLPYDQLRARITESEDDVIDLKAASVRMGREELKASIQRDMERKFNKTARSTKIYEEEPLTYAGILETMTITAWVRTPGKDDFQQYTFKGEDIIADRIVESESNMGGVNTFFRLRKPEGTPFPGGEFVIELSLSKFRGLVNEAYMSLQTELDLSDVSLAKGRAFKQSGPAMAFAK